MKKTTGEVRRKAPRTALTAAGNQPASERVDTTTRMQILTSAMRWFARRGFDGASVTLIASDAGVPQPLINYHFGNKRKLWLAVVDFLFEEWTTALAIHSASLKDLEPVDALKVTLRRHVDFVARRPEFFMLAIVEGREETDRLQYLMERYINPLNQAIETLLVAAQKKRQIRQVPVLNLLEIMIGSTIILFGQSASFRFSDAFTEEHRRLAERHADVVIGVLFDGMAVRPLHE
ncbi:TetR/AcrR family transcriptional regulator [Cupriavidus alkaliphilus]|uniref:TetR/AcrR family transcriptional regulator n=1 Tax=Cupriavidus alkaliphilus TaxID=942866 RepID=UPI001428D65D|nr:TetR/AcrR family transcriptional regulator [Cupriavidus alkaliphilus]